MYISIKSIKQTNLSNLAEPLEVLHGTLGFRGTPVEKHWYTQMEGVKGLMLSLEL